MSHRFLDTSDTKLAELPESCQIHKGISFVVCPHCAIETASGLIDKLEILVNDLDAERKRLTAENQRLKKLLAEWLAPYDGMDADKFVPNVAAQIKETRQVLEETR